MSSSEESYDPDLVEQTKQQIRGLVREIAQLSRSDIAPTEFYDALLTRVVSALAAVGGAIWTVAESGGLQLDYQIRLRDTGLANSEENQIRHGKLLRKVMTTGEGALIPPHSGGDEESGANPTDYLLVLGPLKTDQKVSGVVEVFQRADGNINVQRGYLRFLMQMCELAGDYLKTRQLRHYTDRQALWSQLEQFTRVTHRSLDPKLTAYTIANEGRRLIECDRVSVGLMKGRKCYIEAVSGQDTFDKRSNVITLLNYLATAVAATGEAIWYTGDTSFMAPQVEEAVQDYVDESHSKAIGVIPLKPPKDSARQEQEEEEGDREVVPVLACLVIEQIEDARPKEGLFQRVEVVAEHSSAALSNALEHHSLFLMPVWKAIGSMRWLVKARTLPKTITVSLAVLALLIAAFVVQKDFELEGRGTLEPVEQRDVFATIPNSVVNEVLVDHGALVKAGQPLVVLTNNDLDARITELQGKRQEASAQITTLTNAMQRESGVKQLETQAQIDRFREQESSAAAQLKIYLQEKAQLRVTSPIDGKVVTWDPIRQIKSRPVQPGQVLLTIANVAGAWELEVRMPEDKIGHVAKAREQLRKDLDVKYMFQSDPARSLYGKIKTVQHIAEVHGEEGNTVLIRIEINKSDVEESLLRKGTGVSARINCGRASIGYVYLHDLISFVRTKILFRL